MSVSPQLSYGVRAAALANQVECGDQYIIKELPESVIVAVVDGLGHGEEAAFAAKKAIGIINDYSNGALLSLVDSCHSALKETRGAVLSLAHIQANNKVSWIGIGNVFGLHWQKRNFDRPTIEMLFNKDGIVGLEIPPLKVIEFIAGPGDTLILATDGILTKFTTLTPMSHNLPQTVADDIFEKYRNPNDDALVVVVRWMNLESGN